MAEADISARERDTPPLYQAMSAAGVNYQPWNEPGIKDDECFLCGVVLTEETRTKEDVLPRWLQRAVDGGSHSRPRIILPNQTTMRLAQILIPACKDCNREDLSRNEKLITYAFKAGPDSVANLPEQVLRIWLGKIAYGLRRNDMRLREEISDPLSAPLASEDDIRSMATLHFLLQEARGVVRVARGHSTFFVFRSKIVPCNQCDFDMAFPAGWPHLAMVRLGDVTVMGAVDDRGALNALRKHPAFVAASQLALHPIQVRALLALLIARAARLRVDAVPLLFGLSGQEVWIERGERTGSWTSRARNSTSADVLLGPLIEATADEIAAHGGAIGLLTDEVGMPRQMPIEHGATRLAIS